MEEVYSMQGTERHSRLSRKLGNMFMRYYKVGECFVTPILILDDSKVVDGTLDAGQEVPQGIVILRRDMMDEIMGLNPEGYAAIAAWLEGERRKAIEKMDRLAAWQEEADLSDIDDPEKLEREMLKFLGFMMPEMDTADRLNLVKEGRDHVQKEVEQRCNRDKR